MSNTFEQIDPCNLREELESRYLAYALSTIISRSLPDVRDGLKPVHRRILFAMRALRLDPNSPYKKSARVVGDVIGKYHPHGDQAAYDAMVRLAQEFAVRYPLVDGQGNFGNIDGDSAAAMRYTEARLTSVAKALLEDLEMDTVDFMPTYDGSMEEPVVLPARFPNLLANGSSGIAVGMSTNVPPHNVGEILDACLLLISKPNCSIEELMQHLPAPDFPTGGILMADHAERLEVYSEGRGSLRLRARWAVEDLGRGLWQIVVTEIPYQVQKSRLIERIAQLVIDRKCPFLTNVRDESDENLRIVLEPRARTLDPELIMHFLFKHSDLESRASFNLNVIVGGHRPEVLDLKGILRHWLDHRFVVHTRRASYELKKIRERLHLLQAFLIVHLNIDEVIEIIKKNDDPAPVLMARFSLDEIQAEAILNMRLRNLRKLEEMKIRKEMEELQARADLLEAMLADDKIMWKAIRDELKATRKEFADVRRTEICGSVEDVHVRPEDFVEKEPISVILSQMGWVKANKGHDVNTEVLRFKGDDLLLRSFPCYTNQSVSFISQSGKLFTILASNLPAGKGFGEPLTSMFDLDGGDRVLWALPVDPEQEYLLITRLGQGFRVKGVDLIANQRKGKQLITLKSGDQPLHLHPVKGPWVGSISRSRRLLIFPIEQFPLMAKGKGVRVQKLGADEVVVDVTTFTDEEGFVLDSGKKTKHVTDYDQWHGNRAGRGAMLPHGFLSGAVFAGTGASPLKAGKGLTGELFDD
ncbi:DNA topoisomerase IV subunit A [Magnetococcus marinus MC-1]|uniref:DNA topoisomerase 4 subunit A n=1 Tax=Magnetococcus marinus (strain ATCC BAA-1437 / JCM 17883 / MC-1) TaxID=156889 RepID=A0L827_MAGMM|nr:DNA topoisomerase IV subunit A [Magnetococcus marinus]ABK44120.1 DNA topoisomerase IV subunit A [Magnetococcus marinus MC-1]